MSSGKQPSKSGIVTDADGQRHIPSSVRADGTTRREIKIRPGYRPPEDVEVYRNRTAEAFRTRGKGAGVPGADIASSEEKPSTTASNKNAKRREARRKAKAAAAEGTTDAANEETEDGDIQESEGDTDLGGEVVKATDTVEELQKATADLTVESQADKDKKVKRLKKKLREAKELQSRKDRGEGILPEQLQKVLRIGEITHELEQLGYNEDGEPIKD